MIKVSMEFIELFYSITPFLFSLIVYTILAIALSKSIKKHAKVYYWAFAIVSFASLIPFLLRQMGVELPFNLSALPVLGQSMNELSHAANFVHPVLVLIMFMGAFSPKIKSVGRLMSIRKELSIIVGFPVLSHAVKRIFASFPSGWQYFFDNETYMQSPRVSSALGSGITSFVFVLGLVMFVLFLVLWITSFDSVHRQLGAKRWKKVQKWSYGLYAMLFIHSLGLLVGGMISDNAKAEQQLLAKAQTERVESSSRGSHSHSESAQRGGHQHSSDEKSGEHGQKPSSEQGQKSGGNNVQVSQQQQQGHGGRVKPFSFADVEVSKESKRWISIVILFAVYGSYLYFRLRKSRLARAKKAQARS